MRSVKQSNMQPKDGTDDPMNIQNQKPIVVVPKETSRESLQELREAGYVPLSANPNDVALISTSLRVTGDDLLNAAAEGLMGQYAGTNREVFGTALLKTIKRRFDEHQEGNPSVETT